jgi:TolB protein
MSTALRLAVLATFTQQAAAPSAEALPHFTDARTVLWEKDVKNAYPRWSNDGKRILYETNKGGKWRICVMDADGGNARALTDGKANDNFPDWSPDNRSIAFVSDRDGNEDVFVMKSDGSGPVNLTKNPARDIHPYWTPDGKKILFNSTRDAERLQIYEMTADGKDVRRLVESEDDDTCARVAPGGETFVYLANLASGQDDVMMRKRDGSAPINLTKTRAPDGWPAWTPDGKRIVYSAAPKGHFRLHVMAADGSDPKALTSAEGDYNDARACVSPDGKRVVFNRDVGETIGICVLDLTNVPTTPAK